MQTGIKKNHKGEFRRETYTHFHISVADESGNVYGGHLTEAVISGTGELVLTEIEGTVDRKFDEEIGLNLFEF